MYAADKGRFFKSRMEVPRAPVTVVPLHSASPSYCSCFITRPSPVYGQGCGAFQAAITGKYIHPTRTFPRPDASSHSSELPTVDEEMIAVELSPEIAIAVAADGPGRMYRGIKVGPRFPVTAEPSAANALSSLSSYLQRRPGPVYGIRSGVNRNLLSGKYMRSPSSILPPDDPVVFSHCYPSTEQENSYAAVAEVADRPGRTYHGNEECPRSPATVAPSISSSIRVCSSSSSRPGPVCGQGCGGFRPDSSGEYACIDPNSPALNGCTLQRPASPNGVISVYYQNVRGLRTKIDDFSLASQDSGHDVIILTETNLNDDITSLQLFGTEFNVFRCDRSVDNSEKQSFGGVLIAVSKAHSNAHKVETTRGKQLEQVCVAVSIQGENFLFCAIYIPPEKRADVNLVNEHIATIDELRSTKNADYTTVVCGDYNQSRVQWSLIDGIARPTSPLTAASHWLWSMVWIISTCVKPTWCRTTLDGFLTLSSARRRGLSLWMRLHLLWRFL